MVVIANFREEQYPEVSGTRCIQVFVPDDDAFLGLLAGLLALPGSETNYQQEDIDKAAALAQQWRDAYVLTDWGQCEVGAIVGEIKMLANATLPDGWLYCNGAEVAKATYPALWDAITNFWGTASNPTLNFLLPDLRAKSPVGFAQGGGSPAIGSYGGEATHTLTESEMPTHTHDAPVSTAASGSTGQTAVASSGVFLLTRLATQSKGGGGAHNNLPPYGAVSFIIYAGV